MSRWIATFILLLLAFLHPEDLSGLDREGFQSQSRTDSYLWEVGGRGGLGFRSKDRFEKDLGNFTSTFQPGVFSVSDPFGFRNQRWAEALVRTGFSEDQRFGFVYGSLEFLRAGLNESTSDRFITRLDFDFQTTYLLLTYHYIWNLNKNWGIEAGIGFGGNETRWDTTGFSTNGFSYFPQKSRLKGSGISLRIENSLNYRILDFLILQFGWLWALHSVPYFSGTWNGSVATFYIREDGRTTPLQESRVTDSILVTNQFIRSLDMNAAHFGLHFSFLLRFSD